MQIPDDELPGDNQFWAAVPVKDSLLIRLVDGEPSAEPFGSEVDYLAAPLSVGIGAAEAWRVEVALENDFLAPKRNIPDVLVLANVAAPTVEQADKLSQLVKDGMGLLIFTGAKLDVGLYNDLFFRREDRLLPCPLKTLTDETIHGLIVEPLRPSPLEKLLELKPSALERVPVRQIMTVDEPAEPAQVRVLARWNNPARSPAVIERTKGEGRVLLWTTTADRAGNDWPVEPSFVLAVREAVRGTARPTRLDNTATAGERMRRIVHTSQQITNARLNPPGGSEPETLTAAPFTLPQGDPGTAVVISIPDTRRAGLYRLAWDEGSLGTQQDIYAANPDPRESALERIEATELKAMLEPLAVEIARRAARTTACSRQPAGKSGTTWRRGSWCSWLLNPSSLPGSDARDRRPYPKMIKRLVEIFLGIERSPGAETSGQYRLELTALPQGTSAAVVAVVAVLLVFLFWRLYLRERSDLSWVKRALMVGLRVLTVATVGAMLVEPVLTSTERETVRSHLAVVLDDSESMKFSDPYTDDSRAVEIAAKLKIGTAGGRSPADRLRETPRLSLVKSVLEPTMKDLARGREMFVYNLESAAQPGSGDKAKSRALDDIKPNRSVSPLGDAIHGVLAAHKGQPVAGLILATDGRSNTGEDPLRRPGSDPAEHPDLSDRRRWRRRTPEREIGRGRGQPCRLRARSDDAGRRRRSARAQGHPGDDRTGAKAQ